MSELLLHPVTSRQIQAFAAAPSHAVLLAGPSGSGKLALAVNLTETVLELPSGSFADYPYKMHITQPDGKSIGIETVRLLEHFLSLKVPRKASHNRVVIIENAEALTLEAQNALLKTLEEPPAGTMIILHVTEQQALLPTIRSRCQMIVVKRPDRTAAEAHFLGLGFAKSRVAQAYVISGGLPGLLLALLDQSDHPLLKATDQARRMLSTSSYERLLYVDELSKQRPLALQTTQILQQMAHISLQTASGSAADKWQRVLTAAYQATEALSASVQPKLALSALMLSL